jgi:hypothetical protein
VGSPIDRCFKSQNPRYDAMVYLDRCFRETSFLHLQDRSGLKSNQGLLLADEWPTFLGKSSVFNRLHSVTSQKILFCKYA